MKNMLKHAMKTTTLPNPEMQARIQQVKLGMDWHADHFGVARPGSTAERVLQRRSRRCSPENTVHLL